MEKKFIAYFIIILLIGILIGYVWASMTTLNMCINLAEKYLNITIPPDFLNEVIARLG